MVFLDGINDSLLSSVLHSIEWRLSFGVLKGTCPDSPAFKAVIPNGTNDDGKFVIESPPATGGQQTTIGWYRHEGKIHTRIIEVTHPQ